MSRSLFKRVAVAGLFCLAGLTAARATEAVETVKLAEAPAWSPYWIYGIDFNFNAMPVGLIQVYDAKTERFVGELDSGFSTDGLAVSPDHDTLYVPGIYYSRLTRGTRTDVLDVFDRATLAHVTEIPIPAKHAQTVPTAQDTSISEDGRFVYVSNITPATSVSVVDVKARQFVREVNTAACVQVYPYGKYDFFSMCPDGSILQIALGDDGAETARRKSAPFFDVEHDPVFVNGLRDGQAYVFISFNGQVHRVAVQGTDATFDAPWSLLTPREAARNWRPGGYQVGAYNAHSGLLYVLMHQGGMDTHKDPGTQVWVYDLASHRRLRVLDLAAGLKRAGAQPLLGIQVSQTADDVVLYGFTTDSNLVVADAATGKVRKVVKPFGFSTLQLVNP